MQTLLRCKLHHFKLSIGWVGLQPNHEAGAMPACNNSLPQQMQVNKAAKSALQRHDVNPDPGSSLVQYINCACKAFDTW